MKSESTIEEIYEIEHCVKWIRENDYQKVCLQFPNHLLNDSARISLIFKEKLGQPVYILADTAYESCCIDYVAANHINADAIIHYGPICFSETTNSIPSLNVFERNDFDLDLFNQYYRDKFGDQVEKPRIIIDTDYSYLNRQIGEKFAGSTIELIGIGDSTILGESTVIFIGNNQRKLINLKFHHKKVTFYWYDPNNPSQLENYESDVKILKRRYFLVEKIKDSCTVGIIIATLAVKNYIKIIDRIKKLLNLHQKKYYMISVGKPNVAKLANFPEIDIYVMITCSLNPIYDSKEYYKPIVTPYDVEMALNPLVKNSTIDFSYDFNTFIDNSIVENLDGYDVNELNDVSLITGKVRNNLNNSINDEDNSNTEQLIKFDGTLALNHNYGAGFLAERSWKGLEPKLGENEPKLAEDGRRGIAQSYTHEAATN